MGAPLKRDRRQRPLSVPQPEWFLGGPTLAVELTLKALVQCGSLHSGGAAAAFWLKEHYPNAERQFLPAVRNQFQISSADAVAAIRLASYARKEVSQWRQPI